MKIYLQIHLDNYKNILHNSSYSKIYFPLFNNEWKEQNVNNLIENDLFPAVIEQINKYSVN